MTHYSLERRFVNIQYRVSPKKATIQTQISALIQSTYCSALKFIIAFERRMRKTTQFYTLGT